MAALSDLRTLGQGSGDHSKCIFFTLDTYQAIFISDICKLKICGNGDGHRSSFRPHLDTQVLVTNKYTWKFKCIT